MRKLSCFCIAALIAVSCNKDGGSDGPIIDPKDPYLIVLNEGNYGGGNSDISYVNHLGDVTNKVFETVNKRPLGDVAQSMTRIGGSYYVLMSGSAKIEVMTSAGFNQIKTITGDGETITPQYLLQTGGSEALMSDLYSTKMGVMDLTKNSFIKFIEVGAGTGCMTANNNHIYVGKYDSSAWTYNSILVLDKSSKNIIAEIPSLGMGRTKMLTDKHGKIWAMTSSEFICIDPSKNTIEKSIALPSGIAGNIWSSKCDITRNGETIVFNATINGKSNVFTFNINDTQIGQAKFIADKVVASYNLVVSPEDEICITDAIDYTQSGKLYVYDMKGAILDEYSVGISPQHMMFTR